MKVAAVLVNFNGGDFLAGCVASLRSEAVDRIAVADNGSTDGSIERLLMDEPTLAGSVVATGANLGYGGGANRAAASLRPPPDALLVCNPDVVVHPGTVKALIAALEDDPGLGIVGPLIENADGSIYPSARSFPSLVDAAGHGFLGLIAPKNRFSRRYRRLDADNTRPGRVDWVSGACFLIRWSTWEAIGGFDDKTFFMYMEDVDLCWRASQRGWMVGFEPAARVMHVQGTATSKRPYRMILAHHRSMYRFADRTTTGPERLLLPVMAVGMAVRSGLASLAHWWAGRTRQQTSAL